MKDVTYSIGLLLAMLVGGVHAADKPRAGDIEFFEKRVRPILAKRCYQCHGRRAKSIQGGLQLDTAAGVRRGGASGAVLVPGNPRRSLLIQAIQYGGAIQMPPKSKLPAAEIAVLTQWVKIGAPWPNERNVPLPASDGKFPLAQRKRQHWCWQPVTEPSLPAKDTWSCSPSDRFVHARRRQQGLLPAADTDRSSWLRRVTLDLTGLPPTAKQLAHFVPDGSPLAFERVVDRLLASPRFGEHWARHWMDLVRYAETKGFEGDYTMPYVYRYRDYLIRAFNSDVPYDDFVREHIAGDLMRHPRVNPADGSLESPLGPGYLYLNDGHHGPTDVHADEVRVFENLIDVTGKTFLALTLACARCHDHKFDAITTKDYYSLYGILASSRFHYANRVSPVLLVRQREALQQLRKRVTTELARIWRNQILQLRKQVNQTKSLAPMTRHPRWRRLVENPVGLPLPLQPASRLLAARQDKDRASVWRQLTALKPDRTPASLGGLTHKTFGQWSPAGIGMGVQPVRSGEIVIARRGDQAVQAFVRGASAGHLSSRFDGSLKSPTFRLGQSISVRVKGRRARVRLYIQHYELVGKGVTTGSTNQPVKSDEWRWITINTSLWRGLRAHIEVLHNGDEMDFVTLAQHSAKHSDDGYVAIDRVHNGRPSPTPRLNDYANAWQIRGAAPANRIDAAQFLLDRMARLVSQWEQAALPEYQFDILNNLLLQRMLSTKLDQSARLKHLVERYRQVAGRIPAPVYVRSLSDGLGADEPVYARGSHKAMTSPAPRHFLAAHEPNRFRGRGSGRRQWAEALVDRRNPLTARVIVNRVWAHLFGKGIVTSVDNFGVMGKAPSHPRLFDYVTARFMREGWSLKRLIRHLVLTRTYRLSSVTTTVADKRDPENIWLSHMPVKRLPAESIRDSLLAISGRIHHQMYGPSIPISLSQVTPSRAKPKVDGPLDGAGRRSVYIEIRRNYLSGFLTAFDMPNASVTFGQRAVTNVPAQALAMMNDPFVRQQAAIWAKEILHKKTATGSSRFAARVDLLHRTALGRGATKAEQRRFLALRSSLRKRLKSELKLWTELCHLMFNRKEFIFVVGRPKPANETTSVP